MGLTAAQAAEIIGVRRSSVYRMVSQGRLPKPVKHQRGGLQLDDVERASLQLYRPGRRQQYWVTTAEAAVILGVSNTRVQQLTSAGRLPFVEHKGHRLYRRAQVEVIANAREFRRRPTFRTDQE